MNAIVKAHLEGVEMLDKAKIARIGGVFNEDEPIYFKQEQRLWEAIKPNIKAFLTTYGTNLLKAALEAGPEENVPLTEPRISAWNDCRISFISAIDEGIKEISK